MARDRKSREERREQIVASARGLFAEKGYHRTTVDDIAAACDVARGTFYLYFEDKRALLEVLVDHFFDRIAQCIKSIDTDDPERPAVNQLHANIQRISQLTIENPSMMRIALQGTGVDADFDAKIRDFNRALHRLLDESLEEGQRIGLVRAGDRAIMVSLGVGALKEILLDAATGELPRTADALTDEMLRFLAAGLLRPAD